MNLHDLGWNPTLERHFAIFDRPVKALAALRQPITASVPELTNRIMSKPGERPHMCSANATSCSVASV